jgi:catechol 2,3-dioxygenase-like lactoylglutathione lyase family enzyme
MPDPTPSTWPGKVTNLTLFAEDLDATRSFYGKVFGLKPIFEDADSSVYRFPNIQVNLLRTTAVPELIEPAQLASPDSGVRFLITVDVDDVDAICTELARNGVTLLNGPMDRPWGVRTASFRDPAGHAWEIAH